MHDFSPAVVHHTSRPMQSYNCIGHYNSGPIPFHDGVGHTESGTARLVQILRDENASLKRELDNYYKRVRKVLKVKLLKLM